MAYADQWMDGCIVDRKDLQAFEDLCDLWDIPYKLQKVLKNLVTVDMDIQDYIRVETEIQSRKHR